MSLPSQSFGVQQHTTTVPTTKVPTFFRAGAQVAVPTKVHRRKQKEQNENDGWWLQQRRNRSNNASITTSTVTSNVNTAATTTTTTTTTTAAAANKNSNNNNNIIVQMYHKWHEVSEVVRFLVSGNIGTMFFYCIEQWLYQAIGTNEEQLPPIVSTNKESISFFVGYLLQIATQHILNAVLVYGLDTINTKEKYLNTLIGQYTAYLFALIGSTILNTTLQKGFGISKNIAFISTLSIFAVVNYYVIGYITRRAAMKTQEQQDQNQQNNNNNNNNNEQYKMMTTTTSTTTTLRGGALFDDMFSSSIGLVVDDTYKYC